jgi:hypothetical protein
MRERIENGLVYLLILCVYPVSEWQLRGFTFKWGPDNPLARLWNKIYYLAKRQTNPRRNIHNGLKK